MKRPRPSPAGGPKPEHSACNGTLRVECRIAHGPHGSAAAQDWAVTQVGKECDFEDGISNDSADLIVYFRPPLDPKQLPQVQMAIHYTGRQTPKRSLVWCRTLAPLDEGVPLSLVPDALEYRCWETYQLQLQPGTQHVLALYCTVMNASTHTKPELALQIQVDMKRSFMQAALGTQGAFLSWFPPDVDPAHWGLRVDPRSIPQRTPLWFKLRGEVSGSRAYSLLGWYTNSGPMTAFQKGAMRLGTLSEDYIVLSYCYAFPNRSVREMGWCPAPPTTPLGPWTIPSGWGASPDGAVHDPEMNWDLIPNDLALAGYYASAEVRNAFDITRGGCEFKTSRTKLVVEPYFMAQVYMEMISLGVVWCDLIRYRPARTWDATKGAWRYDDVANVYRIFRDPSLEARLIPLWKRAQANQHILERIIQEPEFVAMREELAALAAKQKPYHVIQVAAHLELSQRLAAYRAHQERAAQPEELSVQQEAEAPEEAHWRAMDERMTELRALRKGDPRFAQLIGEQIQALARLL